MVVCLEESLFFHSTLDMQLKHRITDAPVNKSGLFALSSNSDNNYVAYPGSPNAGEILIFNANTYVRRYFIKFRN